MCRCGLWPLVLFSENDWKEEKEAGAEKKNCKGILIFISN
jgi:hypothetical protein